MTINRRVVLSSRPTGVAQAENFRIEDAELAAPGPGEITVKNAFLSVEPAMRGWIADTGNYSTPVPIGDPMRSLATGVVTASNDAGYAVGDHVKGWFGWQQHATVPVSAVERKITAEQLSLSLGVLGINGITAYLALTLVGQPKAGDTVVVSTAAGSVGSAVGQIAKILGCRTVGIAGGPEKAKLCVDEFGYDAGIDYNAPDMSEQLAKACPDGINVYFDNTSGAISDTVMTQLALYSRIVICGTASIASWDPLPMGPRVHRQILTKRARMEGFIIFDHADRYDEAMNQLGAWVKEGKLRYREDILEGLEACPDAIAGLYRGENLGKRLIRL